MINYQFPTARHGCHGYTDSCFFLSDSSILITNAQGPMPNSQFPNK
ncbi:MULTISPECIES: hypothetical protein [unclassified Microcoleus]